MTLTPEVDSQVTSTGDTSGSTSKAITATSAVITPSTVIPPTTIVCLPTTNTSVPPPPTTQIVTNQSVSSSALPYIALTTSTPVRAVPTKTQAKVRKTIRAVLCAMQYTQVYLLFAFFTVRRTWWT